MRYDRDYAYFRPHFDWYIYIRCVGYIPTPIAPEDAVQAMERFNQRTYHTPPARFRRAIRLTREHPWVARALMRWRG